MEEFVTNLRCKQHQNPCVSVRLNEQTKFEDNIYCLLCLQELKSITDIKTIEEFKQIIRKIQYSSIEIKNDYYQEFLSILVKFQNQITILINFCNEKLHLIQESITQFIENFTIFNDQQLETKIQTIYEFYINKNDSIVSNLIKQNYQDQLANILTNINFNSNKLEGIQGAIQGLKQTIQQINSWKLKENIENNSEDFTFIKKQVIPCECMFAFAFNKDNSILVCANYELFSIYSFFDGKLKENKKIVGHDDIIESIRFSKNNNSFIFGSQDKSIHIWNEIQPMKWQETFKLTGHFRYLNNIIINKKDDEIISTSLDCSIRIWNKNENTWKENQSLNDCMHIFQVDYNSDESQFVSRGNNNLIIWSKENNKKWKEQQKINDLKDGYNVCFINDQLIATQYADGQIELFKMQDKLNRYIKIHNLQLKKDEDFLNPQPLFWNNTKQLLITRHKRSVYIMKLNENQDNLQIQQIIEANILEPLVVLTDDAQYLIYRNHNTILEELIVTKAILNNTH